MQDFAPIPATGGISADDGGVSNMERDPQELVCVAEPGAEGVEVLAPREVPLGGPRALLVRRTLPQCSRSLVGAW